MKKIFLILLLTFASSSAFSQLTIPDLFGTWKIILKTSGSKPQPPPDYLLLMDDSIYTLGVDSVGNSLPGVSTGRWSVTTEGDLVLYPSDRFAETRYYKPSGDKRFRYAGTIKNKTKKPLQIFEMDIYLEKVSKNAKE
jgi:hypothetical protein